MTNEQNGWVKLHRKLLDNPISKRPAYAWTWVTILMLANHKDGVFIVNGRKEIVKRGQFVTGRLKLSQQTGVNQNTLEVILNYLENDGQIQQQKTNKYRVITVINYNDYQEVQQQNNNKITTQQQQNNTNKNIKNDKNILINRDEPSVDNLSVKVEKPIKGISNMAESLQLALDKMKIEKPARNVPEWMRHALEVSDKLKIDWTHPELVKENIKPRWFSLFKRKPWGELQGAYSFCYDYPNKPDSAGMVKLFFWKTGHKDLQLAPLTTKNKGLV